MRDDWTDQFYETSWERNERLAAARRASRCKTCGGNPRIGVPHKPGCNASAETPMGITARNIRGERSMRGRYSFSSWAYGDKDEDVVECPELDAFLGDLDAICKKHGVGFELEAGYGEDGHGKVILVSYEKGDLGFLTESLHESTGVPWIEAAKARYEHHQNKRREAERAAEQAARIAKANNELQAAINGGVIIHGRKFRLVPDGAEMAQEPLKQTSPTVNETGDK